MTTFLWVVLGVVVGLAVFAGLVFWWVKRKLRNFGAALAGLGGGVPPFRISLEPQAEIIWQDPDAAATLSAALVELGYVVSGDFSVPEMDEVHVRGFCNPGFACAAALYEHPQTGLLLDLVRLHKDGTHVLVTATPDPGLEDPPYKRTIRCEGPPDSRAMHEIMQSECAMMEARPITPGVFALMFTTAYAAEMDWRIDRGGVTRAEVVGAAIAGGQDEPADDAIDIVQAQWRAAIDVHWHDEIVATFLKSGAVSAAEWEDYRERLCIVHAGTSPEALADELSAFALDGSALGGSDADDDEDYDQRFESLRRDLETVLGEGDDLFGNLPKALALLPPGRQLRLLGEVERPRRALVYLLEQTD